MRRFLLFSFPYGHFARAGAGPGSGQSAQVRGGHRGDVVTGEPSGPGARAGAGPQVGPRRRQGAGRAADSGPPRPRPRPGRASRWPPGLVRTQSGSGGSRPRGGSPGFVPGKSRLRSSPGIREPRQRGARQAGASTPQDGLGLRSLTRSLRRPLPILRRLLRVL